MPLTARTERALEACHDAILAPTRWSSALQSLGESFGAASCCFLSTTAKTRPRRRRCPMGHEAFSDLWTRNQPHAPDPHVGPCLNDAILHKIGLRLSHRTRSLDGGRAQDTAILSGNGAAGEAGVAGGVVYFSVEGGDWCLPIYPGTTRVRSPREDARRLAKVGPSLAKIVSLARKFAAFDARIETLGAGASEFRRHGHRCERPRNADERACAKSAWRRFQPRTGSSGGARSRKQSPIAAAGFVWLCMRRLAALSPIAPIVVNRDEAPWLLVEAMPVTAFGSDLFSSGRLILLLTDLRSPLRPDATQFCAAFGLTAAEAKMAARLASGVGIDAAAASLGVSRETARSQLKAVFAKTNTRGQAELAATPRASSASGNVTFRPRGRSEVRSSGPARPDRGRCAVRRTAPTHFPGASHPAAIPPPVWIASCMNAGRRSIRFS